MSDWQIDIPYKDRSDLVLDTITAAKEKFGEDDQRTQLVEVLAKDALLNRSSHERRRAPRRSRGTRPGGSPGPP